MLVFSVAVFIQAIILAALYARHKGAGLFDPISQFLAIFTLYVLPLPLRLCFTDFVEGDISAQLPNFVRFVPIAILLCAAGLPLFLWAYYSSAPARIARRLPVPGQPTQSRYFAPFSFDRTRAAAIVICFVSLILLWLLARADPLGFLLLGYNSTSETFGRGYLAAGFPWFFVGSMFFLYRYAHRRQKRDLLIFVGLLLAEIGALVILGDRHSILNMVLAVVIFWHFAIRRIKFKTLALVGVVGFVALNIMGTLRQSNYASLSDFIDKTEASFDPSNNESYFYTLTTGEFVAPFESMPQIIRTLGSDRVPVQWGLTYLHAPLFFIPQVIYPNRPLALQNWYMHAFYDPNNPQNISRQFFFLAEGYMNFGPIGVVLVMLLWGVLLGSLDRYRQQHASNPGVALICALSIAFIPLKCIGGDFVGLVVGLPEQELIVCCLGLWYATRFHRAIFLANNATDAIEVSNVWVNSRRTPATADRKQD